jgi:2-methylisocitrate lyase-like PEP mutase family enzyme
MSVTQNEKAARFRALHDGPGAFVIPNPWDVGSARIRQLSVPLEDG